MTKKKVLITGAAGLVGGHLRRYWGDRYQLRLSDVKPIEDLQPHEEFVEMDITQYDEFLAACQGMDLVVHLAADPSMQGEFYKTLLNLNIIGCYNGFEAAREAKCQRIVFASSVNAILGHGDKTPVPWETPVYPINVYGATKCWGEALARAYAHEHGLSCICVRIGGAAFKQDGKWRQGEPNMGISGRDQAQLFARCLDAPEDLKFKIVHGISKHEDLWMDLEVSREIGYEPEDGTAFPHAG
jgi:nucleoside-diphosphate-sugar epimerase